MAWCLDSIIIIIIIQVAFDTDFVSVNLISTWLNNFVIFSSLMWFDLVIIQILLKMKQNTELINTSEGKSDINFGYIFWYIWIKNFWVIYIFLAKLVKFFGKNLVQTPQADRLLNHRKLKALLSTTGFNSLFRMPLFLSCGYWLWCGCVTSLSIMLV